MKVKRIEEQEKTHRQYLQRITEEARVVLSFRKEVLDKYNMALKKKYFDSCPDNLFFDETGHHLVRTTGG